MKDTFKEVIKRVSNKLDKDPRVVEYVARQQFRYIAREVIADPHTEHSYRAQYLGVFTPKYKSKKSEKRWKNYWQEKSEIARQEQAESGTVEAGEGSIQTEGVKEL